MGAVARNRKLRVAPQGFSREDFAVWPGGER